MKSPTHDRLLAALIAKLPSSTEPWMREDRVAWLRMMAMAFDVVYGPCGEIRIASEAAPAAMAIAPAPVASAAIGATDDTEPAPCRFYVDHDGFAMADERPIAMEDLPANATLWDERSGIECGDVAAILWRDTGATRRSLPPGVILKAAMHAA
jgi:hypothetical protein